MNGLGFAALIALGIAIFLIWEYWPEPADEEADQ